MTLYDILEQVKQLNPQERRELVQHVLAMPNDEMSSATPKTGAEIVAMLEQMEPIEFVDPDILDPVEWVKAQRRKEAERLKPYWGDDE